MNNRILTALFALALCLCLFIGVVPAEADAACSHPVNQREVVLAKAPTCTEKGNIQYYVCTATGCGKRFSSATTQVAYNDMSAVELDMVPHVSDGVLHTKTDDPNHWNVCVNCGQMMNITAHDYSIPTAVEDNEVSHNMACACGALRAYGEEHDWEKVVTAEGHTYTCKGCKMVSKDSGVHVDAYKADKTSGKDCKCDTCGYELEHVYSDWCPDATAHAHLCENCGNVEDWGEHTFEYTHVDGDEHSKVCTVCGYSEASEHCSEGDVVDHNCDKCGDPLTHRWNADGKSGSYVAAKPATCEEAGNIEYKVCAVCDRPFNYDGEILTEDELVVSALGHDFKENWDWSSTHHYHVCENGCTELQDRAEHTLTYEYLNDGTHRVSCTVCGYTDTVGCSIDENCTCVCGHFMNHRSSQDKMVYTNYKAATCEKAGNLGYYTCTDCGTVFVKTVKDDDSAVAYTEAGDPTIPALGHKWVHKKDTLSGKHLVECDVCHVSEAIPHTSSTGGCTCDIMLNGTTICGQLVHSHEAVWVEGQEPTCQEEGFEGYWKYEACGRMFENDFARTEIEAPIAIPIVDHEPGEWEKDGDEHVKYCTVCGEELDSDEHVDDNYDNRCDVCHFELTLELVEEVPATCTESGTKAYYISEVTGRSYWDEAGTQYISNADDKLIAPLGHDDVTTDLGNGKHQTTCSRCERTLTAEAHTTGGCFCTKCGAANGTHKPTTFERVEATCDKDGHLAYVKCSCGKFYNVLGEETTYKALTLKSTGHKWGAKIFNDDAAGKHYAVCENCGAKNYGEHKLTVNDPLSGNWHQSICECGKVSLELHYDKNGDNVCDEAGCKHDMSNKEVTVNNNPSTTVVTGDKNTVKTGWSWLRNWLNNTVGSNAGGSTTPTQTAQPGTATGSQGSTTGNNGTTNTPATGSNTGSTGAGSSNAGSSTQGGNQTAEATGVLQAIISFFNWILSGFGG